MKTAEQRFNEKWIQEPFTCCWLWTGYQNNKGYGRMSLGSRKQGAVFAHRFSYEHFIGKIPKGLELDHLCKTPSCVNPKHLEPVTHRVNMLRGDTPFSRNYQKTHCINGHPLTGYNLIWKSEGHKFNRSRCCKICKMEGDRIRGKRYRLKKLKKESLA